MLKKNKHKSNQRGNQAKASNRNWHKLCVAGMLAHCNKMKKSKHLSFQEQMKILRCKVVLEEILSDWKPIL